MARIIVIGAGMGGMAAAARLKVKGHDVTVIEASDTHGGKLGTVRRDGFAFDTGASLFTIPAFFIGKAIINDPKLIYFSNREDRPRGESWAGLLFAALAILAFLRSAPI